MTDVSVPLDRDSRAPLWWLLHLTTLKDVKFYVKPSEFSTGKGKGEGKGGRGGGRGGAPYGRGAGRGGQVTSIFSGNDAVQQIFGDEGENAQDFNAWMDDPEPSAALAVTRSASMIVAGTPSAPFVDLTLSADNSSRSTTPLSPISESPASHRTPVADIETIVDSDNESVPSLEEPSPEANKPEAGAASSPSAAVSQWQSNVKPTESGDAAVQDAQAAQVQPEVPLLSESASMNTIKLAAPINVSRKITLKITDPHR